MPKRFLLPTVLDCAMSGSIDFTTVSSPSEVRQILDLQAANLPAVLTPDAMASQGFVTVRHDPACSSA